MVRPVDNIYYSVVRWLDLLTVLWAICDSFFYYFHSPLRKSIAKNSHANAD